MSNSMVKIDVHLTFHIKTTSVQMNPGDLPRIFAYIDGILREIGSIPLIVGGISDHVHILASLPPSMTISELARIMKANSSRWIKTLSPVYSTFTWRTGYRAFSVSPSLLDKTFLYIKNQECHHRTKTFQDEYKAFLAAYKILYDEKYLVNDWSRNGCIIHGYLPYPWVFTHGCILAPLRGSDINPNIEKFLPCCFTCLYKITDCLCSSKITSMIKPSRWNAVVGQKRCEYCTITKKCSFP